MEAKATAKSLRVSPIKTRITIDLIRGKKASEAGNSLNSVSASTLHLSEFALPRSP